MRRNLVLGSAAAVLAALVVSNPLVADAARLITSADIANGTIQSRDIDNKTIKAKDLAPNAVKSWNIADGIVQGKDVKDGTLTRADFAAGQLPIAAYARVTADNTAAALDATRSANVSGVTRTNAGVYCLELAAGVDRGVAVLAQAEGAPAGFGTNEAAWSGVCGSNGVEVTTEQLSTTGGQLASNRVNTVSFNVLVP